MKTDRKLLELAAKAAGIEWFGYAGDDECECRYFDIGDDQVIEWNPLTDDGDALRLAVKLEIDVCFGANYVTVRGSAQMPTVNNDNDPYAATRRAIVRAAAAIGEVMP